MSSMRNWKHFHSPGDKMSTFMRSSPSAADERATEVKRSLPRARSRKKVVPLTARECAAALRR